jgi:hypothetical protein
MVNDPPNLEASLERGIKTAISFTVDDKELIKVRNIKNRPLAKEITEYVVKIHKEDYPTYKKLVEGIFEYFCTQHSRYPGKEYLPRFRSVIYNWFLRKTKAPKEAIYIIEHLWSIGYFSPLGFKPNNQFVAFTHAMWENNKKHATNVTASRDLITLEKEHAQCLKEMISKLRNEYGRNYTSQAKNITEWLLTSNVMDRCTVDGIYRALERVRTEAVDNIRISIERVELLKHISNMYMQDPQMVIDIGRGLPPICKKETFPVPDNTIQDVFNSTKEDIKKYAQPSYDNYLKLAMCYKNFFDKVAEILENKHN